jgi:hypothetical protein
MKPSLKNKSNLVLYYLTRGEYGQGFTKPEKFSKKKYRLGGIVRENVY